MAERLYSEMTSSNDVDWRFKIFDDSYSSSSIEVTCDDFELSYNGSSDDPAYPILTSELTLTIFDDGTAGVATAITSIETSDEKNIRVTIERNTGAGYEFYWAGIVLKDSIVRYNSAEPREITIRAVCGLTRLKDIEFDEAVDGTYSSNQTVLQYLLDALDYNGLSTHWGASDDYFRESIEWYDNAMTTTGNTDSPLLQTRHSVEHFIIKDDNEDDRPRTAWDVVYKTMELWCAQILLTNGAYYIRQVKNSDGTTQVIRGIDKSLTVNSGASVSNDVSVTSAIAADEVRVLGGGEYYRLAPLDEVVGTVQPQKYVNYAKSGDKAFTYSNDPQTLTYSLGALRGGSGSLQYLKIQYRIKSNFDDTVTSSKMSQFGVRLTITLSLVAGGATYYLKVNSLTGVFTWETSPATVELFIEGSEWGEEGRMSFLYANQFTTPEIPSSTITSSTLTIQHHVYDFKAGAVAGAGASGMEWIAQDAYVYLVNDGETPRSTEVRIPNPTSSDNSMVQDLGELWLNDLSIISGKNQFEVFDNTSWVASTTWDAGFGTDTSLVYTMLYERMALRRTPMLKYRGTFAGDYEPWQWISYGSEALVFMNGTYSGKMDEWSGEWFDYQRNATNVGSTITERDWRDRQDDIDWSRTPNTTKWVKKYSVHERIATLGAEYLVSSGATTTLTLFAAVNHENLKDNDKVYIYHPLTMEELDSFTISTDVTSSDTSLSVDSQIPAQDLSIGSLVMIKRDELTASEGVRGQQFMVNGQLADSSPLNRAIFESSDSGQLSYKNSSGVVAPLGEMVTETALSQAQIQSLDSTPVEIAPTPGSGYYYDVQRITIFYDHNGTEYSGTVGATLEAEYSATSTRVAFDTSDIFLQGADYNGQMTIDNIYHNSGLRDLSNMDGSAIRLTNSVSYTGSGGPATVRVYYKIVKI